MNVAQLYASGRIHPLRPLGQALTLPSRDRFAAAGQVIFEAMQSLLSQNVERADPAFHAVMRHELARGRGLGFTRLDVVCPPEDPAAFALLEVQAGDPSAMAWSDALCEALGERPVLLPAHRRPFEALTKERTIAFAVLKGSVVESDHRLLAEHYAANGWEAAVVEPSQLRFEQGRLTAAGWPVGAVFRDALDELGAGAEHLVAAVLADAVALMNPIVSAIADDKALLEALSTPARWPREVAQALARHVPCTRLVSERRCDWEGAEVDLPAFLARSREQAVLKPIDGYGGFGITLGPFVSDADWQKALDAALAKPGRFVAQRWVPLPRHRVETLDGELEGWVVHSLWFCPALEGAFARASASPLVNVHQGGGLAPVLFRS